MATRGVGDMSDHEVADFIRASPCGVLTMLDRDKPYSVVLEHYYDGRDFYFVTSTREEQRKLRCIERNHNASYMIYESRREKPEMIKHGTMCRSVLVEGVVTLAGIKPIESQEFGSVTLRLLKLEQRQISNWRCPRQCCDWHMRWYDRHPGLVADL